MVERHATKRSPVVVGLLGGALIVGPACGDDGGGDQNPPRESVSDGVGKELTGSVELSLLAGHGVSGLAAGPGEGEVVDGWTVHYKKFLVTIGSFEFTQADGSPLLYDASGIVDLLDLSPALTLVTLELQPGTTSVGFSVPNAIDRFSPLASTTSADRDLMVSGGYSIYVEGTIEKPDGSSCSPDAPSECVKAPSISFRWGLAAGEAFSDCADLHVIEDDALDATLTLAGDRWLHTAFEESAGAPQLRAQWIADADLDHDGETTLAELEAIKATSLLLPALGYELSGAPVQVETARDFLEAQARMIGRNGMGLCRTMTQLK